MALAAALISEAEADAAKELPSSWITGETDEILLLRDSHIDVKLKGEGKSSTTSQKARKRSGSDQSD